MTHSRRWRCEFVLDPFSGAGNFLSSRSRRTERAQICNLGRETTLSPEKKRQRVQVCRLISKKRRCVSPAFPRINSRRWLKPTSRRPSLSLPKLALRRNHQRTSSICRGATRGDTIPQAQWRAFAALRCLTTTGKPNARPGPCRGLGYRTTR